MQDASAYYVKVILVGGGERVEVYDDYRAALRAIGYSSLKPGEYATISVVRWVQERGVWTRKPVVIESGWRPAESSSDSE